MTTTPPAPCATCGGPIDTELDAQKRRFHARIGKPYTPPKVCAACVVKALFSEELEEGDGAA